MGNLETMFLTIRWSDLLERMNETSKVLQSKEVNTLVATNLLEPMETHLQKTGDEFSEYEFKAASIFRCRLTMGKNVNEVPVLVNMMD